VAGNVLKGRFPQARLVRIVAANATRLLFGGAARNWARNVASTAPALCSMALVLLMTGLIGLTAYALNNVEQQQAAQASLLHVYLRDDAQAADVFMLQQRLLADPRVSSVTYTSKDDALARAQSMPGLPQLADATDSNPFPASLDVHVKNIDDMAAIDAIARADSTTDPAQPTSYDKGAYQRLQAVLFGIAVAGLTFIGLLGFVAVTVTMNSVKAAIHSRRDEISIMQLVGAPRWMVRGPFVIEGAMTGGLAGAVAGLTTFGLAAAAIAAGAGNFSQFAPGVTMTVALIAGVAVVAAGLVLGSGSSLLTLRRHMES
jgi:cell division transport system permease protein